MKIPMMVTADYATVDPLTGKLHILGVFRSISAQSFPCKHSRMCLALIIEGEIADSRNPHELSVSLAGEDGQELLSMQGGFELPPHTGGVPPQTNVLLELNDLSFDQPGEYCFYARVNDHEVEDPELEGSTAIQVVQTGNGSE
ncbi:MAG: hypothetical protein OXE95_04745 [Chloroflexi bacterium]|nr:hypothetical protein [Chloroflexota bacterium]MCY4246870.1 hypothetical protein [Chloroflexota bacterium]